MRERTIHPLLAGALAVALAVAAAPAQERDVVRGARERGAEVQRMDVDVEHAAGRLRVGPAPAGMLYTFRFVFDSGIFQPRRDFSVEEGVGRLRLGIEGAGGGSDRSFWSRLLHFDFGFNVESDEEATLAVELAPDIPTRLELSAGAAEADLELGGLALTSLTYETGASDTEIDFHRPNRTVMEEMKLRMGAAALRAGGLGNARFRRLTVKGGAGDLRLDFRGAWTGDAEATIEVGMASLRLVVPPELGVRIRKRSFLSSFSAPGFIETEDGYVSQNWDAAEHHLVVDVEAALGSVEVDIES